MKKILSLLLLPASLLILLNACNTQRFTEGNTFYNKYNELNTKVHSGLFSSKHVEIGNFSTSHKKNNDMEESSNAHNIPNAQNPFNFTINDGRGNESFVQCLYTNISSLSNVNLPLNFAAGENDKVFYSLIGGGNLAPLSNWQLVVKSPTLNDMKANALVGVLQSINSKVNISAQNYLGSKNSTNHTVYEFRLNGLPVAAVKVDKQEQVWMDRNLAGELRFAITGAIASLLMQ